MEKIISYAEAQAAFDALAQDIAHDQTSHYIVVAEGYPALTVLAHAEYLRLQRLAEREQAQLARFDAMTARRATLDLPYSDEEIDADIEAARQEVYDQRQRRSDR